VYDTQQQLVEVEEAMVAAKQRAEKHALQLNERLHVAQESAAVVQYLKKKNRNKPKKAQRAPTRAQESAAEVQYLKQQTIPTVVSFMW
jgi:glutathione S-transferase